MSFPKNLNYQIESLDRTEPVDTLDRFQTPDVGSEKFKIVLFGHSWVKNLETANLLKIPNCEISFISKSGATFNAMNNEQFLSQLPQEVNLVIVLLGSNDCHLSLNQMKIDAANLFRNIQTKIATFHPSGSNLICCQIESRFYSDSNRHHKSPTLFEFNSVSNYFNLWLIKRRKTLKVSDVIFLHGKNNPLNKIEHYRPDGVHLTPLGLSILTQKIRERILVYQTRFYNHTLPNHPFRKFHIQKN